MKIRQSGKRIAHGEPRTAYYALAGGEDLISPALKAEPGRAIFTRNYECDINGRYRRIDGYEAFDGQPKPSDATYYILDFDQGTAEMTAGDTVTGASSAAYGTLLYQVKESGTYAGSDAAGYLVLTNVSGTFTDNEQLQVSAVTEAYADGTAALSAADDEDLHDTYQQAAIEAARDNIAAVPGSGDILGVCSLGSTKYAFRNNAGGTAACLYKSSASGWTLCSLGRYMAFTSGGTYEVQEGDTITGETSGATAVITRIRLEDGAWADGDAAGDFIFASQTGTFQSETVKVGATLNVATIAADSTAITLAASGRYEFVVENFFAGSTTKRIYGCDGVNKCFEWDGTVFVPISTGLTTDTPNHIVGFKNHLFVSLPGGLIQHSEPGWPYQWSGALGAAELGVGDEVSGFQVIADTLIVLARNRIKKLTGTSVDDWVFGDLDKEAGGIEWTFQKIGSGLFLDDRGITSIAAVQEYGDFGQNIISEDVKPFLDKYITTIQSSLRCRKKSQYRLYFTDMQGLILTLKKGKVVGFTRTLYDKLPVCTWSGEDSSGNEELFFGSDDGFIYELDKGTSLNGNAVEAYLRTHFYHIDTPNHRKRIRPMRLEADAPLGTQIYASIDFDYGEEGNAGETISMLSGGGAWDISEWDSFVWDTNFVGQGTLDINGSGTNFSLLFYSSMTYVKPHTLQGLTVPYDIRGMKR